jgi:hypothetical protein
MSVAAVPVLQPMAKKLAELDRLAGQPVDIGPWSYAWRADRTEQGKPEAEFIPRRLERIDKVYRTAFDALPQDQLKSIHYQMPDLLNPLLPQPQGELLAGLLWSGLLADYDLQLQWPEGDQESPPPAAVEVRTYPASYGWFGWTVDRILSRRDISADRRTWTYKSDPGATMDWAYNVRVDAATEMIAVFYDAQQAPVGARPSVPSLRVTKSGTRRVETHGCGDRVGLPSWNGRGSV